MSSDLSPFLQRLQSSLAELAHPTSGSPYVVAYSGGVDSHVLLYSCRELGLPVRAVHIHHGLQKVADHWVRHCQQICAGLDIEFDVIYVDARAQSGNRQSPEEAARIARYDALYSNLRDGECLLTAQHMNDQAETLFLQLMRGAGAAGLAGMPAQALRERNMHLRPLLNFTRDELESFAYDNALDWVDDPSNQDTNLDRNFIRQQILPMLESRWPEVTARLSSAARLQADNLDVIESMAATDLANCIRVWQPVTAASLYDVLSGISIDQLLALPAARQLNVLRYWIIDSLTKGVSSHRSISPTRKLLMEISGSMLSAQRDAEPKILFSDVEFRRYQNRLYIIRERSEPTGDSEPLILSMTQPVRMADIKICLLRSDLPGQGLAAQVVDKALTVKYRQGGEELKPAGRSHSQRLKKLLQENDIPPWDRSRLPLFYLGDELVAVADLLIADAYQAAADEQGWRIVFEQAGPATAES